MNGNEFAVLLAVGPEGVQDGALDLAAAEATARGTGVELLHVMHSMVAVPNSTEDLELVDRSLSKVGRDVLTDAAARMRQRLDRLPVSTQLLTGPVAATVTDRAADAEVVILERRDAGTFERLVTMSISTRVAAHATTPVVVVPRSWSSAGSEELPVTVGVDRATEALGQVETAAAYAATRDRELRVLHAAWLAEPYQSIALTGRGGREWVREARAELEMSLHKLPEPTPKLSADVQWERPVDALVAATRTSSSLLVLSRRAGGQPLAAHLGGVTRTVLHHASCPVMVVDRT